MDVRAEAQIEAQIDAQKDEDAQWMIGFQRGDSECFERLFNKYKESLINFSYRFTGRRDVAEELAQEILVKCYLAARTYEPKAKFKTWLFKIARNHCLNEMRRQDYHHSTKPIDYEMDLKGFATPEEEVQARALGRATEEALARLPEAQRTALLLNRFQAMSYEEIAETMSTSVSAVKSLLNRAKTTLLKQLGQLLELCHEM